MKKITILIVAGICFLALVYYWSGTDLATQVVREEKVIPAAEQVVPVDQRFPYVLEPGSSLGAAFRNLDISNQEIHELVVAAKPIRDLGKLSAGTRFQIGYKTPDNQMLSRVHFRISPQEELLIEKNDQGLWQAQKIEKKVETRVITFKGTVESSLWDSAVQAEMNPILISALAEIFAWQVDFAREVRIGDRWRLSVEEESVHGEKIGWGSILSAEYTNGSTTHTAVLFRKDKEDLGYFAPDGNSLKRVFLKSPIQYGKISSRFQKKRFHPVLKIFRPHNGVDYSAPIGTPIRSVGDGVIAKIGRNAGAGNFINIRHNSTYATAYKHLSRFAKGMRSGTRVEQGQTIGYVGSTGLSTGAHLHFEFYVDGRYVDPLGKKFPAAAPVPPEQLSEFDQSKKTFLAYLPAWDGEEQVLQQ